MKYIIIFTMLVFLAACSYDEEHAKNTTEQTDSVKNDRLIFKTDTTWKDTIHIDF